MSSNPLFKEYDDLPLDEDAQSRLFGMYVMFAVYFVGLLGVGIMAFKKKAELERARSRASRADIQAHYTGTYPPVFVALTIFASAFSGYTVVGVPQTTMERGYLVLQFFSGACAQSVALAVLVPRLRRIGVERGYLSPFDFVADRYRSRPVTILVVIAASIPQFIYLAVQLASFGETLNSLSRGLLTKTVGVVFCVVFMLTMEFVGGLHAVVLSDIVQAIIMLAGFAILIVILAARFDVFSMGSDTCPSAATIIGNATTIPNCIPGGPPYAETKDYGCIFRTQPQFLKDLNTYGTEDLGIPIPFALNMKFFWFVATFFAFPLNPHMLQRLFLPETDEDGKKALQLIVFSPLVAMTPGVIAGIVAAAYLPQWTQQLGGCASAFGLVGTIIQLEGGAIEYFVVALLSCAALAAIMSSADSLILGVSNSVCVDIYRNMMNPDASATQVVRVGQVVSLVMALCSALLAMQVSGSTFINWFGVQNGILFQAGPAMLYGLYTKAPARAILAGLIVGFAVLIPLQYLAVFSSSAALRGLLDIVANAQSLAAIANFTVVHCMSRGSEDEVPVEDSYSETLATRFEGGATILTLKDIDDAMQGSTPPNRNLMLASLLVLLGTIPILPIPEGRVGIMPTWAFVIGLFIVLNMVLVFLTLSSWKPAPETGKSMELTGYGGPLM